MEPNYVAKKSAASACNFWLILFFWLIVPLIIQIARIMVAKSYSIEFYDNKMIIKSGVLTKKEDQAVFRNIYAVNITQTLMGRMFNYGDIRVDCAGAWDIDTTGISDPIALKKFLENRISDKGATNVIYN